MINRKAKAVELPIPIEAVMHDWWMAINVAKHGQIAYIPQQLVLYRQHSTNVLGAETASTWSLLKAPFALRKRILQHYAMVKKYDPNAIFLVVMVKKIANKIAQQCR